MQMASPKSIFYTYKYVWEDGTPYYVGKGKEDRAFVDHGEVPVPEDRNRIIFLIENVTEEEAFQHENEMINFYGRKDLGTGPLLNRTSGGQGVSGRLLTEEQKEKCREAGKIGGKTCYERGVGIHALTKEERIENGKIIGNKSKENKTGICGLSPEERSAAGKKGGTTQGNKNKENKTGICGLSLEERIKNGKKYGKIGGNKHKENKTGIFGISPKERSENGKKGGKSSTSQKWKCTETGYVSHAAGLTVYQNKRGIDTSNRIKVDGPRGWEITFEDNRVVVTYKTLKEWAEENGYSYSCLGHVMGGRTKIYKGIIKVAPCV